MESLDNQKELRSDKIIARDNLCFNCAPIYTLSARTKPCTAEHDTGVEARVNFKAHGK